MSDTRGGGRMIHWPHEGTRRSGLDQEIDRAIRQMMDVDAGPAFRAHVFARLERPALSWFTTSRIAVCSVTIAVVVLAFVLTQPVQEVPSTGTARRNAAPAAVPRTGLEASAGVGEASGQRVPKVAAHRRAASPRASQRASPGPTSGNATQRVPAGAIVASVADQSPDPPAGWRHSIAPVAVEPISSPPIMTSPIVIAPLAPITPIEIAPLTPRFERE